MVTLLEISAQIKAAEKEIKDAEDEILKAKAAGVDVSVQEADLIKAKQALEKLKEQYGK